METRTKTFYVCEVPSSQCAAPNGPKIETLEPPMNTIRAKPINHYSYVS